MNVKKHESSLLEVFSDAGSTPAASTNNKFLELDVYARHYPDCASGNGSREEDYVLLSAMHCCKTMCASSLARSGRCANLRGQGFASAYV